MMMLANRGFSTLGFVCLFSDGWYLLRFADIDWDAKKTYKDKMTKLNEDANKTFL
jgi:hypothetical protein